jgi:serine/threonine protein kinase/tetratricopeptide (TPR) repeat protein
VTPERWQQIKIVLAGALDREDGDRTVFLDGICREDADLRREVESLLATERELGDFIEIPVFRIHPEGSGPPLAVGQRIGAYRIVREVGRGGMGSVYLAERADQEFEQRVALKVVRRGMDTDEIVHRFRAERQILAHLDHPNIAKLFDGGTTEDGRPYFVMEYVEGKPIDEDCDARKLSTAERLELFRTVCAAVHFAHQNLIVHRDLKPGNILVTADGKPKLLDFGIAKLLDPNQEPFALTRADLRMMTPDYASPEQVRGEAITTASDIYSLGVLLYVLLTGHRPYRASTQQPEELARAILEVEPVRPSSVVARFEEVKRSDGSVQALTPESVSRVRDGEQRLLRRRLSGDLDNIVLKAMQKDPQRRYASVDQLSADLERHLQGLPVVARKDTLGYRTWKFVGRHPGGVAVAALLLLLILGFGITATVLWQRAVRGEQQAQAVSAFLEDLFTGADPKQSHGDELTAKDLLDRGVQKIRSGLKTEPFVRAELSKTLGRVYRDLGWYADARPLLAEALDLHRQTLREDDYRIVQDMQNLGNDLHSMGRQTEAKPLLKKAIEIQREHQATHDIVFAKNLTNLGSIVEEEGDLAQAEKLYQESLAIKKKTPDTEPEDMAASFNLFGRLYSTWGKYSLAEQYYQKALGIRQHLAGGRPDPEVATSLGNLGSLQQDRGDFAGAISFYRRALEMRRQLFKGPNFKTSVSLNNLGYALQASGDLAGAERCYREALAIPVEYLPSVSTPRAGFLRNLASVLVAEGKIAEAEADAREAAAIFHAKSPKHWRSADADSLLGGCFVAQGKFQEAEPLLLKSYPILKADSGDGAKHAEEARQRIVDLYTAWGKPEKAAEFRAKA